MASQLPKIVTDSVPGPASLALAKRLGQTECAEITYLSANFPVFWHKARGCMVTDVDGNRYLDATSSFGVLGTGHGHPDVISAIASQAKKLIHGMGDVHPSEAKVRLLESIQGHVPIPDSRIILGQNGSDSVEAALKTAALATGKPRVLAFQGGYHGLSYGALETTARGFFREPWTAQRGKFATHLPYGCDVADIRAAFAADAGIGAVIVEPIQGRGGIRIPPPGWLSSVHKACRAAGVLLIADEIFTGWGRTGAWFACNLEDVVPDLLCIGKAMGGGMPISACVGSLRLMTAAWGSGSTGESRHTYTFLGHPLSCAAAVAAIHALDDRNLIERSRVRGAMLLDGLAAIAARHPRQTVEARGRGLMTGLQFVDAETARSVMVRALSRGLIVLPAGDDGDVLELTPPFVITKRQIAWLLTTLEDIIVRASH